MWVRWEVVHLPLLARDQLPAESKVPWRRNVHFYLLDLSVQRLLTFSLLTKYTALFLRTQGQSVRIWKYIDFSFVHKSFVSVYQFFPCHNQRRAEVVKCNLKMNLLIPIIILINIRIIISRTCNCPVMFWVMTSSWCRSLSKKCYDDQLILLIVKILMMIKWGYKWARHLSKTFHDDYDDIEHRLK